MVRVMSRGCHGGVPLWILHCGSYVVQVSEWESRGWRAMEGVPLWCPAGYLKSSE